MLYAAKTKKRPNDNYNNMATILSLARPRLKRFGTDPFVRESRSVATMRHRLVDFLSIFETVRTPAMHIWVERAVFNALRELRIIGGDPLQRLRAYYPPSLAHALRAMASPDGVVSLHASAVAADRFLRQQQVAARRAAAKAATDAARAAINLVSDDDDDDGVEADDEAWPDGHNRGAAAAA